MILYHFSIEMYAESIRKHGVLSIAEKMRRGFYEETGWRPAPTVFAMENELVWLTRDPESYAGIKGNGAPVRVTVDVEGALRWARAADRYGVPAWWRRVLSEGALELSPGNHDRDWYVVEQPIFPAQIVSIEVLKEAAA